MMTSQTKPLLTAGASLLTAATVVAATPVIAAGGNPAVALHSATSGYEMLSNQSSLGGGLLQVIEKFLADHETAVLAFAAKVPSFDIGPVGVGNAVLAHAYYDGYNGSATGLPGVIAYVESQLGLPGTKLASTAAANATTTHPLEALILKLTAMIPKFKIGPVQLGGSLLADAFYNGYNGSPTGLPGIIAYVKSQLGVPTTGASTVPKHAAAAVASIPKHAAAAVTVSVPKAATAAVSVPSPKKVPASASAKHAAAAPSAAAHKNGHKT
jgi:hypothetical protein